MSCAFTVTQWCLYWKTAEVRSKDQGDQKLQMHTTSVCASAGLEVIPDLEVPCPSDDAAVPDSLPSSPQPPGFSGQKSPECEP